MPSPSSQSPGYSAASESTSVRPSHPFTKPFPDPTDDSHNHRSPTRPHKNETPQTHHLRLRRHPLRHARLYRPLHLPHLRPPLPSRYRPTVLAQAGLTDAVDLVLGDMPGVRRKPDPVAFVEIVAPWYRMPAQLYPSFRPDHHKTVPSIRPWKTILMVYVWSILKTPCYS